MIFYTKFETAHSGVQIYAEDSRCPETDVSAAPTEERVFIKTFLPSCLQGGFLIIKLLSARDFPTNSIRR